MRVNDVCFYCMRVCHISGIKTNDASDLYTSSYVALTLDPPRSNVSDSNVQERRERAQMAAIRLATASRSNQRHDSDRDIGEMRLGWEANSYYVKRTRIYILLTFMLALPLLCTSGWIIAKSYRKCKDQECAHKTCESYVSSVECQERATCQCIDRAVDTFVLALGACAYLCIVVWSIMRGLMDMDPRYRTVKTACRLVLVSLICYGGASVIHMFIFYFWMERFAYSVAWAFVLMGLIAQACIFSACTES